MCDGCEEEKRRVAIRQNLAWLDVADAVNAACRQALARQAALLDQDPRPMGLWEMIQAIGTELSTQVQALQSGLGHTRQ